MSQPLKTKSENRASRVIAKGRIFQQNCKASHVKLTATENEFLMIIIRVKVS